MLPANVAKVSRAKDNPTLLAFSFSRAPAKCDCFLGTDRVWFNKVQTDFSIPSVAL